MELYAPIKPSTTLAEEFVKKVYSNLNDIKKSFFTVGYL